MKKRNGFTLIELLVVIAIIGLLLGIMVPVLSKVMNSAKMKTGMANARNIVMGCNSFADGNKSWFAGLNSKGALPTTEFVGKLYAAKMLTAAGPKVEECNDYALAVLLESGDIAPAQLLSPGETNGSITEVVSSSDGTASSGTAGQDGAVGKLNNSFSFLHWGVAALKGEWKMNTNTQAVVVTDRLIFGAASGKQYSIWSDKDSGKYTGAVVRGESTASMENVTAADGTALENAAFLTNLKYAGAVSNKHITCTTSVFSIWGKSDANTNFGSNVDTTTGADDKGKVGSANDSITTTP